MNESDHARSGFVTRVQSRIRLSPSLVDLRIFLGAHAVLPFRPGQFVTVSCGAADSSASCKRSYSICSTETPAREEIRLLIRTRAEHAAHALPAALAPGDVVHVAGPHGQLHLDDSHRGDVVFCATGTGVSAFFPMIAALADRHEPGRRSLHWGIRTEEDLEALPDLKRLCENARVRLSTYVSNPSPTWQGPRGRLNDAVLDLAAKLDRPTFYLVGHTAMVQAVRRGLSELGIAPQCVRKEAHID
jgi:CDP-4-dehydro-6-deoxyglucose reductase, E3